MSKDDLHEKCTTSLPETCKDIGHCTFCQQPSDELIIKLAFNQRNVPLCLLHSLAINISNNYNVRNESLDCA